MALTDILLCGLLFCSGFQLIEKPFLEAVKLTLGDRYTENIENIYKTTIHFILETLVEGYDMAEKKAVGGQ